MVHLKITRKKRSLRNVIWLSFANWSSTVFESYQRSFCISCFMKAVVCFFCFPFWFDWHVLWSLLDLWSLLNILRSNFRKMFVSIFIAFFLRSCIFKPKCFSFLPARFLEEYRKLRACDITYFIDLDLL